MNRTIEQPQGPISMVASVIGGVVIGFLVGWPTALFGLSASLTGAIIGGVVALVAAQFFGRTHQPVAVSDPPIARELNSTTRFAPMWLAIRLIVGADWVLAGWHKFQDPGWMETGKSLQGYWTRAVAIPAQGSAPISFEWWRAFLTFLNDSGSYTWFAKLITFGELAVGLGLIFGAFVGLAAGGGILMNMSFLLAGSTSSNPVLLFLEIGIILAWKVAGWIGLDRWLLPALGTTWSPGYVFNREKTPPPPPSTSATPQLR